MQSNPKAKIINLGIGNTTQPLTPHITKALVKAAEGMGSIDGYTGYGEEQGFTDLRARIAEKVYNGLVKSDEVFISDGTKCDIGRIQLMFGSDLSVAIQDPSYPVYVDGSVICGASKNYNASKQHFDGIVYLSCTPENGFFPDLGNTPRTDLIYFCSPNNPTGAVATKNQLTELVDYAAKNKSIIIFDAAYREYIRDKYLPKSIFEIDGARDVAMEINSFSKSVGFTGIRLGWSVVPTQLKYEGGESVINDWNRIMTTVFNGASNIVQYGGLAALDDKGRDEMSQTIDYYMENARLIKDALGDIGIVAYGGTNSPYIWAHFKGRRSWDVFEEILEKTYVVTTPGSGFGPAGEGFIRFSAFGRKKDIKEAVERLKTRLKI